jgi:hypothetical protein
MEPGDAPNMNLLRSVSSLVVITALVAAGCVEVNPDYQSPDGSVNQSCSPGQRRCWGQTAQVCGSGGTFINDRTCPGGSKCERGFCFPTGAACESEAGCKGSAVCTLFVKPDGSGLGNYCADPVGSKGPAALCTANAQCQSGICLTRQSFSFCYSPCSRSKHCKSGRCYAVVMTITGVQASVKSCTP